MSEHYGTFEKLIFVNNNNVGDPHEAECSAHYQPTKVLAEIQHN